MKFERIYIHAYVYVRVCESSVVSVSGNERIPGEDVLNYALLHLGTRWGKGRRRKHLSFYRLNDLTDI